MFHDSEHHPSFFGVVWYRVSGGLFVWLVVYYPVSFTRMGWSPSGILAHMVLSLVQATIVTLFAFFHLYGLVTSLDLVCFLPEALACHLRWGPLMEKKTRVVRFITQWKASETQPQGETNAEEFGLLPHHET